MSKNVKILQDGQEKTLNKVSKIQTQLANGLTCNWIPEDEVPLGELTVSSDGVYNPAQDPNGPYYGYSKVTVSGVGTTVMGQLAEITITKNGTYSASADNDGPFYGYSKVIVNVKSSDDGGGGSSSRPVVPGKDSDGDDAVGTIDDDGNIVVEKLPSEIKVIVTPDNLEYEDGQSIVFDGLLVKAYYPDGTEYDSIPTTDLIRPVRVAEFDEETYSQGIGTVESEYGNIKFMRSEDVSISYPSAVDGYMNTNYDFDPGYMCLTFNDKALAVRELGGRLNYKSHEFRMSYGQITEVTIDGYHNVSRTLGYALAFNYDGFGNKCNAAYADYFPKNNLDITIGELLILINNGNVTYTEGGSQQVIPLQWERPGDKKVLETSFTITVHASDDSGDSGGSGGGSGPQPQPTPPPS